VPALRAEEPGARDRRRHPALRQLPQAAALVVDTGDEDFAEVAERASVPVLIDLWAPWCGPCRMVSPALEQLAAEMAGRLKLVKVNVDESPKLQQRFGVQAIPTLMVLRDGRVAARQAGAAPAPALRAWLEQTLQS